jgi:hypothetical protein
LRHPVRGCRSILRSFEQNQAVEFVDQFPTSAPSPSLDSVSEQRYAGVENPLWEYFESHREGPGIWKWAHYFEIYQRHLSKFVGRNPHVVEVGVYSGGSLGMWRHYFGPGSQVSGIDIETSCLSYKTQGISIYIGDQADRGFWKRFRGEAPAVDVLIDDGGHSREQQRITLEEMLPQLRPGGVYLCEDVCGVNNAFAAYAQKLVDLLNAIGGMPPHESDGGNGFIATPFQRMVHSIHFYPFVIVIERTDFPVDRLRSPKHGTEWQPFL